MRPLLQAPVVAMLFCLPATAQENVPPKAQEKIEIGQGIICDTLQQVERYVALRGNGTETNVALETMNDTARVAVCTVALVVFSAGAHVADLTVQGKRLSIIQINVHAFGNGPVWMRIPTAIRYTVTAEKGQIV
jgi:hypothetical protein